MTRNGQWVALDRTADPEGWWRTAYGPDVIVTQRNDGEPPARFESPPPLPTSSCSMPKLVFRMLDTLKVDDGMRVLEIGTGSGWNAGLLAHRLGAERVTSVEIDPRVCCHARQALASASLHPTVIRGDGAGGHPPRAPYDRVIVTCGASRIPRAWIAQTRAGGLILVPWVSGPAMGNNILARLTVHPDGCASGRFVGEASFMPLRQQRPVHPGPPLDIQGHGDGDYQISTTMLDPVALLIDHPDDAAAVVATIALGTARYGTRTNRGNGERGLWISDHHSGSWARAFPSGHVEQSGPRRLWDQVEHAHRQWVQAGEPSLDRYGLTVTAKGRHVVWLDDPSRPVARGVAGAA